MPAIVKSQYPQLRFREAAMPAQQPTKKILRQSGFWADGVLSIFPVYLNLNGSAVFTFPTFKRVLFQENPEAS